MRQMTCSFIVAALAAFMTMPPSASTEDVRRYSGDLGTRPALSGDWGGARTGLAGKGITFDMSLTQIGQGIVGGGKKTGWEVGGRGDLVVNADTAKMNLWQGGLFTVEVEGNFGQDVNTWTGALMEVNASQTFPKSGEYGRDFPTLMLTQFFLKEFGIILGKVGTGSDANEFASGKGDTQFFNIALTFNPAAFLTIPYSTKGAGVIVAPSGDVRTAVIKFFVLDETSYAAEGRVRTEFLGLTGHQLIGVSYASKSFTALTQNLRVLLEDHTIEERNRSWCLYYNFDQYLYEAKRGSGQGFGIFGRFGVSDGDPNTVHYFFSFGAAGKGIIPGRPLDSFGIGYYGIIVGNPTFVGLFANRSFLGNEQGVEAYYNIGITPWMKLAPDIQLIRPAQRQMIGGGGVGITHVDTATVVGIRLQLVL